MRNESNDSGSAEVFSCGNNLSQLNMLVRFGCILIAWLLVKCISSYMVAVLIFSSLDACTQ